MIRKRRIDYSEFVFFFSVDANIAQAFHFMSQYWYYGKISKKNNVERTLLVRVFVRKVVIYLEITRIGRCEISLRGRRCCVYPCRSQSKSRGCSCRVMDVLIGRKHSAPGSGRCSHTGTRRGLNVPTVLCKQISKKIYHIKLKCAVQDGDLIVV